MSNSKFTSFFIIALVLLPTSALAADTVETYDSGTINIDFFLGVDGFNHSDDRRLVFSDMMVGYGIANNFCSYAGVTLHGDGPTLTGHSDLYLGLFATLETAAL